MHSHARTSAENDDNPYLPLLPLILSPESARRSSQKNDWERQPIARVTLATPADQMEAHRKSDQHRDDPCTDRPHKRALARISPRSIS
jgi:hypothetical protein